MSRPRFRVRTPSGKDSKWSAPSSSASTCRDVRLNWAVSSSSPGSMYSCHRRTSKRKVMQCSKVISLKYETKRLKTRSITFVLVFTNGFGWKRQFIDVILEQRSPFAELIQQGPRSCHRYGKHNHGWWICVFCQGIPEKVCMAWIPIQQPHSQVCMVCSIKRVVWKYILVYFHCSKLIHHIELNA